MVEDIVRVVRGLHIHQPIVNGEPSIDYCVGVLDDIGLLLKPEIRKRLSVSALKEERQDEKTRCRLRDVPESNEDFELGDGPGRDSLDGLS